MSGAPVDKGTARRIRLTAPQQQTFGTEVTTWTYSKYKPMRKPNEFHCGIDRIPSPFVLSRISIPLYIFLRTGSCFCHLMDHRLKVANDNFSSVA
ncbi:hypothetical protein ACTXT7_016658 [Hymenolepis weldensis]